jgi:hypothetical protein
VEVADPPTTPNTTLASVGAIIKDVARVISSGIGRTNEERVEHELFDDADAWIRSDMEAYRQKAGAQLDTVGSGDHYIDLIRDEEGFVWIGEPRPWAHQRDALPRGRRRQEAARMA